MLIEITNNDAKTTYDVHIEYLRKPLVGLPEGKKSRGVPYETNAVVSKVDQIHYDEQGKVVSVDSTVIGFGKAVANVGKRDKKTKKIVGQEAFCKRVGRRLAIYRALEDAIENGHLSTVLTLEPKKVRTIEAFFEQLEKQMKI